MNIGHDGTARRGPARMMRNIDMYRKIPSDLMEGTKSGSFLSHMCLIFMVALFTFETIAFFKTDTVTDIALDTNTEETLRLNFNITMMDLKCDHAVVDVVSVLGTNQNITAHVTKWHVDADGVRQRYQGRNKQQSTIELSDEAVTQTIEELHEDGEDAIELDDETFEYAKNEYEYLFVDFYANWCSHCRDLAPTWETLAEVMTDAMNHSFEEKHGDKKHDYSEEEENAAKSVELPVMVAKVDCAHYPKLCQEQQLVATPTLRMFVDGEPWPKEYNGHRRVVDMVKWLAEVEEEHKSELMGDATKNEVNRKVQVAHEKALARMKVENKPEEQARFAADIKRKKNKASSNNKKQWNDEDHPGCQLAGYLKLPRAPGNFHIQARSPHHNLIPHMTNVSHIVHHLSIGEPLMERRLEKLGVVPSDARMKFSPMNGNVYVTHQLHQAHHHYLKVITTSAAQDKPVKDDYYRFGGKSSMYAYQILQNSQLWFYSEDIVPEAKFMYDLSPIAISYRHQSRHWYDYLTSIMAIIGGAFTVFGMVESVTHAALCRAKKRF